MFNLFKKKPEDAPVQRPVSSMPPLEPNHPAPRLDHLLVEPSYDDLVRLEVSGAEATLKLEPLTIVGLGPVGRMTLERLASWLPNERTHHGPVRLLAIDFEDAPSLDHLLPTLHDNRLTESQRVELRIPFNNLQSGSGHPWFQEAHGYEWGRTQGRLGAFHDLAQYPSRLWKLMEGIWTNSVEHAVWIVGSTFDPSGSGLLFDVAHIIRLTATAVNKHPFVGWLLALPSRDWGDEYQSEAAATVRELTRLLQPDLIRVFEPYNLASDNDYLRGSKKDGYSEQGSEANLVMLCAPRPDQYGQVAGTLVVNQISLFLYGLAQPDVWESFISQHKTSLQPPQKPVWVSGFGLTAHYLPLVELKQFVRTRLLADVLTGKEWGAAPPRRSSIQSDEQKAVNFLSSTQYPLLAAVARPNDRLKQYSIDDAVLAGTALRLLLRGQLEKDINDSPARNDFAACQSLLRGLQEVLQVSSADPELLEPLTVSVIQAIHQLQNWQKSWPKLDTFIQGQIEAAENQWGQALTLPGLQAVIESDFASMTYQQWIEPISSFVLLYEIRKYIHWAWIIDNEEIQLRLDVLVPGWEKANQSEWRHRAGDGPDAFANLTQTVLSVIEALTRDPRRWPTGVSASGTLLPSANAVQHEAEIALQLTAQLSGGTHTLRSQHWQISGDPAWLQRNWWPQEYAAVRVRSGEAYLGIVAQIQSPILIENIAQVQEAYKRYFKDSTRLSKQIFRPEQLASKIEAHAKQVITAHWPHLSEVEETRLFQARLSTQTIAALQWELLAKLWPQAWLAGLVISSTGSGPYQIVIPSESGADDTIIIEVKGPHVLDGLYQFTAGLYPGAHAIRPAQWERLRNELDQMQTVLQTKLAQQPNGLNQNDRDLEWALYLYGLLGE